MIQLGGFIVFEKQTMERKRDYNQKAQDTMLAFLNTDGGFLIRIPNLNYAIEDSISNGKMTNGAKEKRLIDAFSDTRFTKEDAAEVLGISASGAYKLLLKLTEQGLIVSKKDGKKLMYSIVNPQTE